MLDICELTSFVIRSELMWFHDSIFSEHAFSTTIQMKNLGRNVTLRYGNLSVKKLIFFSPPLICSKFHCMLLVCSLKQ